MEKTTKLANAEYVRLQNIRYDDQRLALLIALNDGYADLIALEQRKKDANSEFDAAIKAKRKDLNGIHAEINNPQPTLPFGDGVICVATGSGASDRAYEEEIGKLSEESDSEGQ